jgi:hypothetical protein
MTAACANLVNEGVIRGVLGAVDCQTRAFAEAGYSSLTQASSTFQVGLTALLTIYVALVGYRMLFAAGGARLSDAPGIALKIGAILALVTSWATFQTLVFDLAAHAPGEISRAVAAPLQAQGGSLAADPVGGLQTAYDQLTQAAAAFGKTAGPNVKAYSSPAAAAAEALFAAASVLFMTPAGVVAFGFRLRRPDATARPAEAARPAPAQPALEPASRAQRLAFDLQRDQAAAAARLHTSHLATVTAAASAGGTAPAPRDYPSERPARLGEAYRRPAVARPMGSRA